MAKHPCQTEAQGIERIQFNCLLSVSLVLQELFLGSFLYNMADKLY